MKKLLIIPTLCFLAFCISACGDVKSDSEQQSVSSQDYESEISSIGTSETMSNYDEKEQTQMKVKIQIGDKTFTAKLEDNDTAKEFAQMLPISVEMRDYGGFEKVGSLGRTITSNDSQTTTSAGDIVLYNSDQIVIFYGSNSWSYTRLGHIDNFGDIENGNITAIFSLE